MHRHTESVILRYRRALARKRRGVDKKGLAVALVFLIAVSLWGLWRIAQTPQHEIVWQQRPNLSATIAIRPGLTSVPEEETSQPVQSLGGAAAALHDPRQRR